MLDLIKYDPFSWRSPFHRLIDIHDEFERLFGNLFSLSPATLYSGVSFTPVVDLIEEEDKYIIRAELPGMSRKEIKVEATDNHLTISGEKKEEEQQTEGYHHTAERHYGAFCRTFHLNSKIKADKVNAHYANGVLELALPKAEAIRDKQIEVKVE